MYSLTDYMKLKPYYLRNAEIDRKCFIVACKMPMKEVKLHTMTLYYYE